MKKHLGSFRGAKFGESSRSIGQNMSKPAIGCYSFFFLLGTATGIFSYCMLRHVFESHVGCSGQTLVAFVDESHMQICSFCWLEGFFGNCCDVTVY